MTFGNQRWVFIHHPSTYYSGLKHRCYLSTYYSGLRHRSCPALYLQIDRRTSSRHLFLSPPSNASATCSLLSSLVLCTMPKSSEDNEPLLYFLIKGHCLVFCPKIGLTCCWYNATNQCYKNSISLENFSIGQRGAGLLLSSNHCKHKSQCLHFREPRVNYII